MSPSSHTAAPSKFDELHDFLQRLEGTDTSQLGIDLLVARESDEEDSEEPSYDFGRVNIVQGIAQELEQLVREKVDNKRTALSSENISLAEYSLGNRERDEEFLQYEDVENIPNFDEFSRLLDGRRFHPTTFIEPPKPEFQAIRIRDDNNNEMAIAFLNYTRRQILGSTSRVRMAMGDETHTQVEGSIMSIPDRVDAIYYQGVIFIFSQSKFEKVFDYLHEYERRADEVIEVIEESDIPFHDFDMFQEAVYGNNRVLRLMHKVHERGTYESLTPRDADYIRENFNSDVKFEENSDGEMEIKMDDKRDVWAVLRFFNDDHLDSPITDESYISLSKEDG